MEKCKCLVTDLPTDPLTGVCARQAYASKKKPYSFNLNDKSVKTGEKYKIGGNIGKMYKIDGGRVKVKH